MERGRRLTRKVMCKEPRDKEDGKHWHVCGVSRPMREPGKGVRDSSLRWRAAENRRTDSVMVNIMSVCGVCVIDE